MGQTSRIEVDLSAVTHNMAVLRRIVGRGCAICPVVKADAYGLGAARITATLVRSEAGGGADMLAVYTLDQAKGILPVAGDVPVLVLGPVSKITPEPAVRQALGAGLLHLTVHDAGHLERLIGIAERCGARLPLHLEIDTGMSRGGCGLAAAPEVLRRIARSPRVSLAGLSTHFAAAESDAAMTDTQDRRFETLLETHAPLVPPDCIVHAANTCATLRGTRYHKSMVRVGQAWAGYGPECIRDGRAVPGADDLRPSVTFASRIVQRKWIEPGTPVGYGATWTARRRTLIGLVPVGYADGYPFALSEPAALGRGPTVAVLVERRGVTVRRDAPVVGRISMDQITIDVTDLREDVEHDARARRDTPVQLITPDRDAPNHLVRIADAARTTPYEILCRLNPRIRRRYRQDHHPLVEVILPPASRAPAGETPRRASWVP